MNRQEIFQTLRQHPEVSVLIVGGGVNGIGVFRELAVQGVDVLLVEKGDFCSGASAGSSHMIHGGLRYLENGEFRLVREALTERNLLLKNAPHYVKPLPTTIPIFRWFSGITNAPMKFLNLTEKPSERGALVIKIGLTFYDWFTRSHQTMPTHRFFTRRESLEKRPYLNPNIVCTAKYYDAWMPSPERICLELILDAEATSSQVRALNYMKLASGAGDTVILHDELSDDSYEIKPKLVINAAGPWIDFANRSMQRPTRFIGGTKGSHLVVDHQELYEATMGEELFFENEDGRIVLMFPLEDKVLVGTTDIYIDDPDQARCTDDEIEYMLNLIRRVLPGIGVDRSHIVFCFTGVRPLPSSESSRTGTISRDHSCLFTPPDSQIHFPIYSLVGGKWTTFRAFSEKVVDKILPKLRRTRKTHTDHMAIGGGKNYPTAHTEREHWLKNVRDRSGIDQDRLNILFDRYGTRAAEIADFIMAEKDAPLQHKSDYSHREIIFLAEQEKIVHLDDLVLRRSLIAMLGYLNCALLEELADILAEPLGWSASHKQAEIDRTVAIMRDHHRVELK